MDDLRKRFEETGFVVIAEAVPTEIVGKLREEADRFLARSASRGGVRNLLHRSRRLAAAGRHGAPVEIAREILGAGARPTKLTLFNKTADANWLIRWHQDLTITVKERRDVPGFSGWSLKEGVLHVRPPAEVLESIVAVRVHLDHTPASNGALRVVPGSHRLGKLTRQQIESSRLSGREFVCEVPTGGAMVMSPLLLHASSKASAPTNRRVLHFEYSAADLPSGLEWA